jgi:endonuclease G
MSRKSDKWNFIFALIAFAFFGLFVYFYLNQPSDKVEENEHIGKSAEKKVEVIDFSKESSGRKTNITSISKGLLYAGEPIRTTYPNKITILKNEGFIVGYDEKRRNPAWVAYKVRSCISGKSLVCYIGLKRPTRFMVDYRTITQVKAKEYNRSKYDRGHMAPNHAIALHYGENAQRETFLMSNVIPQRPSLNRGVWKEIEHAISDDYAERLEEVWVFVGPIYDPKIPDKFLKRTGIEIPDRFYAVVLDELKGRPRAMAFVVPQDVSINVDPSQFIVSVDEVEKQSGFDFFSGLEDAREEKMEQEKVRL